MSLSPDQQRAVMSMGADRATVELARAFRSSGIRWLLLKGPVIAERLYADGARRPYSDVDAFVAPQHYELSEKVLAELGYEPVPDSTRRDTEHASPWRRGDGSEVDLHRSVAHLTAPRERVWNSLSAGATSIDVAGEHVDAPSGGALALVVAMHALHHARAVAKPLADLERALARLSEDDWADARTLASELGAERNLAAAL